MAKYINVDALGIGPCNASVFADVSYAKGWNAVIKILDDMPAADVRPVVRGKWLPDCEDAIFNCSVCDGIMVRNVYNFCPWCGADMAPPKGD